MENNKSIKVVVDYTHGTYTVMGIGMFEGKLAEITKPIRGEDSDGRFKASYSRDLIRARRAEMNEDIIKILRQYPDFKYSSEMIKKVDPLMYKILKTWDERNVTNYAEVYLKTIIQEFPIKEDYEYDVFEEECTMARNEELEKAGIDISYNVALFNTSRSLTFMDKIKGILMARNQKKLFNAKVNSSWTLKRDYYLGDIKQFKEESKEFETPEKTAERKSMKLSNETFKKFEYKVKDAPETEEDLAKRAEKFAEALKKAEEAKKALEIQKQQEEAERRAAIQKAKEQAEENRRKAEELRKIEAQEAEERKTAIERTMEAAKNARKTRFEKLQKMRIGEPLTAEDEIEIENQTINWTREIEDESEAIQNKVHKVKFGEKISLRLVPIKEFLFRKREFPKIEMPKVKMPKVEMPKIEIPKVELPKPDVSKVTRRVGAGLRHFTRIITDAKESIFEIAANFKTTIGEKATEAGRTIKTKAGEAKTTIGTKASEAKTIIGEKATEAGRTIKTKAGEAGTVIGTKASEAKTIIGEKATEAGRTIKTKAIEAGTAIGNTASGVATTIATTAKTEAPKVTRRVKAEARHFTRVVNDITDSIRNKKFKPHLSRTGKKVVITGVATALVFGLAVNLGGSQQNGIETIPGYGTGTYVEIFDSEREPTETTVQAQEEVAEDTVSAGIFESSDSEQESSKVESIKTEEAVQVEEDIQEEITSEVDEVQEETIEEVEDTRTDEEKIEEFREIAIQKYESAIIIGEKPELGDLLEDQTYSSTPNGGGKKGSFAKHPDYAIGHINIINKTGYTVVRAEGKSLADLLAENPDCVSYSIHFINTKTGGGLGFVTKEQYEEMVGNKIDQIIESKTIDKTVELDVDDLIQ